MSTIVGIEPVDGTPAVASTIESASLFRRLLRRPAAVVSMVWLAIVVVVAIAAPIIWPHVATQNAGDIFDVLKGPSWQHLLGTDSDGRDVLQRLLVGTRVTMLGVAEAVLVTLAIGVPAGLTAAKLELTARDTLEVGAEPAVLSPGARVAVILRRGGTAFAATSEQSFTATAAVETALEVDLLLEGGILPYILRRSLREPAGD